jgi:hypothetical protein|uniref:Uncharacterized protein n=1 Tax=Myoviridae sp. ctcyQ27 TaxID=2825139 RepID=A0A8S5UF54_9CAUD|nr:MAG TPA: hypothetical protein [Myoviridae sp. ctcyQ27]
MEHSKSTKKDLMKQMIKKLNKQDKEINQLKLLLYNNIQTKRLIQDEKPSRQISFLRGEDETFYD